MLSDAETAALAHAKLAGINPHTAGGQVTEIEFTKTRSLWLPKTFVENAERGASEAHPLDIGLRISYGASHLLAKEASWDSVAAALQHYTIEQVLDICARVTLVINHTSSGWSEGQQRVLAGLLGPGKAATLWARVKQLEAADPEIPASPALFNDLQTLTLAKAAFLTDLPLQPITESWDALTEALLMINDLIFDQKLGGDIDTPEGRQAWHQALMVNGLFHHSENELHATARAFELYLMDRPHLRDHPQYIDLPGLVRETTGIRPELLWAILFAFRAHWQSIKLDSLMDSPGSIDRESYFTQGYDFSPNEIDQFFSLVATDMAQMRAQIRHDYSFDDIRPFHFLPFARWPLIGSESHFFCVSVRLLAAKTSRGLHYLFLDSVPEEGMRNKYLQYLGLAFEDYVDQLLKRTYPAASGRYISEQHLRDRIPGRVCDGALLYGDALLLIEVKAPGFTLAARAGENWDEYTSKLDAIFLDGARQIDSTIIGVEGGHLRDLGVEPSATQHYFPLIVTLENLPMNRLIYEHIDSRVKEENLFDSEKVRPWQAIDVGELEFLEVAVNEGRSLRDLLDEKTSNADSVTEGLGNYCYRRGERFFTHGMNSHLAEVFETVCQRATAIFSERSKKGDSEE